MFHNFLFENCAVYGVKWKNTVEPHRPQMKIRCMRIALWIRKATNTQSEYVIRIAFPLQQWLHKRVSVLRYNYTVCLVIANTRTCNLCHKYDKILTRNYNFKQTSCVLWPHTKIVQRKSEEVISEGLCNLCFKSFKIRTPFLLPLWVLDTPLGNTSISVICCDIRLQVCDVFCYIRLTMENEIFDILVRNELTLSLCNTQQLLTRRRAGNGKVGDAKGTHLLGSLHKIPSSFVTDIVKWLFSQTA